MYVLLFTSGKMPAMECFSAPTAEDVGEAASSANEETGACGNKKKTPPPGDRI